MISHRADAAVIAERPRRCRNNPFAAAAVAAVAAAVVVAVVTTLVQREQAQGATALCRVPSWAWPAKESPV